MAIRNATTTSVASRPPKMLFMMMPTAQNFQNTARMIRRAPPPFKGF
jgi:hypothetical protein